MPSTLTRVVNVYRTGSTDITTPPNGWVGSKLGTKGDLVTLDSNGRVDQAVAAGSNVGANTRLALLNDAVASTVAQGASVGIEKLDDDTLIELPVTSGDSAISTPSTTLPTLIGKQYEIRRVTTSGIYTVDTSATTNVKCEVVSLGTVFPTSDNFSTVLVKILSAARIN